MEKGEDRAAACCGRFHTLEVIMAIALTAAVKPEETKFHLMLFINHNIVL